MLLDVPKGGNCWPLFMELVERRILSLAKTRMWALHLELLELKDLQVTVKFGELQECAVKIIRAQIC